LKVQPGGFGDAEKTFNDVRLDGNEEDFSSPLAVVPRI
jgi:hypothetical protein